MQWLHLAVLHLQIWTGLDWGSLRSLGNSRLIRTSFLWFILVPVVARLLENLPESVTVAVFNIELKIPFCLPFRWTYFYFMSVSFALAQAVYLLQCPAIIKNYNKFVDFRKHHLGVLAICTQLEMEFGKEKYGGPNSLSALVVGVDKEIGSALKGSSPELLPLVRESHESVQNDLFDILVWHIRVQKLPAMVVSALFFALGGLFFVILSVQSFWTVITTL